MRSGAASMIFLVIRTLSRIFWSETRSCGEMSMIRSILLASIAASTSDASAGPI